VSADYGTEHFRSFHHERNGSEWIHVIYRRDDSGALGDFSREEIAELVELAEQAWPGLTVSLAIAVLRRSADERLADMHFHSATGQENTPCLCDQPGTYARQAPNPLAPDF
jgi:hypothetical protein